MIKSLRGKPGARVYAEPDRLSRVIRTLESQRVDVVAVAGKWVSVKLDNGKLGHVRSKDIDTVSIDPAPEPHRPAPLHAAMARYFEANGQGGVANALRQPRQPPQEEPQPYGPDAVDQLPTEEQLGRRFSPGEIGARAILRRGL